MKTRTSRPSSVTKTATREEYLQAMATAAPFAEFENGRMVLKSAAQGRHGKVLRWLVETLYRDVVDRFSMALYQAVCVDFGAHIFVPDVIVLDEAQKTRFDTHSGLFDGAPNLVIEIVCHDSGARDRVLKYDHYFRYGVPWYWVIDPFEFTIEEWHATEKGYLRTAAATIDDVFGPQAFPGFAIVAKEMFPGDT